MDNLLRKAGQMTPYIELFRRIEAVRQLLVLAYAMDERSGRAAMVNAESITIFGADTTTEAAFNARNNTADAPTCYATLATLKGHAAPEYAVTRDELKALNRRAQGELEISQELADFGTVLTQILNDGKTGGGDSRTAATDPRGVSADPEGKDAAPDATLPSGEAKAPGATDGAPAKTRARTAADASNDPARA